jgi:hypothetical protein
MTEEKIMFYVIETKYAGPNPNENINLSRVVISTTPCRENLNNKIKIHGWCGTSNCISTFAHGRFETVDQAREFVNERFGNVAELENPMSDEYVLEMYSTSQYIHLNVHESYGWTIEMVCEDVDHNTTDEKIKNLVIEYEKIANDEGLSLSPDLEMAIRMYRVILKVKNKCSTKYKF